MYQTISWLGAGARQAPCFTRSNKLKAVTAHRVQASVFGAV